MEIPASVIVLTRNEERNIRGCLEALDGFDEVFVVDSESTDGTAEIARECGASVVSFRWNGRYPKKKQWALESLPFRNDWVLYVDADEIVTEALALEIRDVLRSGRGKAGYFISLEYVFLNRPMKHGHRVDKLALIDRTVARWVEWDDLAAQNMWEVEGHYQPVVDGDVGRLENVIRHHDHDDLFHYFERHNRYSDWEALVRAERRIRPSAESQTLTRRVAKRWFDRTPGKGLLAFIHSYVLRSGYRDGRAGFHYALARGFYYWQVGLKTHERRVQRSR
jgi:glycosyltransferase involved in cell wall biosynthesis